MSTADAFTFNIEQMMDFDRSLQVGQRVNVRWTNCGSDWSGRATVIKVNQKTIRVKLDEAVGPYPLETVLIINKFTCKWCLWNAAFPLEAAGVKRLVYAPHL